MKRLGVKLTGGMLASMCDALVPQEKEDYLAVWTKREGQGVPIFVPSFLFALLLSTGVTLIYIHSLSCWFLCWLLTMYQQAQLHSPLVKSNTKVLVSILLMSCGNFFHMNFVLHLDNRLLKFVPASFLPVSLSSGFSFCEILCPHSSSFSKEFSCPKQ